MSTCACVQSKMALCTDGIMIKLKNSRHYHLREIKSWLTQNNHYEIQKGDNTIAITARGYLLAANRHIKN